MKDCLEDLSGRTNKQGAVFRDDDDIWRIQSEVMQSLLPVTKPNAHIRIEFVTQRYPLPPSSHPTSQVRHSSPPEGVDMKTN